jgi:hypothetical protein
MSVTGSEQKIGAKMEEVTEDLIKLHTLIRSYIIFTLCRYYDDQIKIIRCEVNVTHERERERERERELI